MKKSLSEVSELKLEEITSTLNESPAFKYFKEKDIIKSDRGARELSSFFTVLLKMAWIDRDLTKSEIRYLVRESEDWSALEEDTVKKLIDVHSSLVRRNTKFAEMIPYHIAYLGKVLDEPARKELFEILVVISRSDLDVSKIEEDFLEKVGKCLKIESRFFSETVMNAKFITNTRKEKKAVAAKKDDDQPYEVPDIHFDW